MSSNVSLTPKSLLPRLRSDLELTVAPSEEQGKPVWMLHDPIHATFTRLDWIQFEIVKRLDKVQPASKLLERLEHETTIREAATEILQFVEELIAYGLTEKTLHKNSAFLIAEQQQRKTGFFKWIVYHYLYFRIPLIHPDNFLENTMGFIRVLSSRVLLFFYLIIGLIGLYFLSQRFDEYIHTFTSFLNPKGFICYGISIALLKIFHEFSHAYTAKHFGNHIPTMGLAFIVLWPIPYCDVTDSWRMHSRHQRLRISAAGILTELIIAGISLFIWGISNNPTLSSITFVLSSLTLISTLLVNLNPLMRFDGYYIFSDLTGIDNLQFRAFNMTRWFYRRKLLGMQLDCPEPELSLKRKVFMLAYSICTWTYRFFLYTGIAVVVYYTFPKIIGILLFTIEIFTFIIRPLYRELTTDISLIRGKRISLRFAIFIIILIILLIWLAIPLPRYISIPAITSAAETQIIYSPTSGTISGMNIVRNHKVTVGEQLLAIDSHQLQAEIKLAELNISQLAIQLKQVAARTELKGLAPQIRETYLQAKAKLRSLKEALKQSRITADINGTVTDLKETLRSGVAVYKGEELGRIYNLNSLTLTLYAPSRAASSLQPGDVVEFIPDYASYRNIRYKAIIQNIRPNREDFLKHPGLASHNGGPIDVIPDKNEQLKMIYPYFTIECGVSGLEQSSELSQTLRFDQPGIAVYWSRPRSYIKDLIQHIYQVLMRESGI